MRRYGPGRHGRSFVYSCAVKRSAGEVDSGGRLMNAIFFCKNGIESYVLVKIGLVVFLCLSETRIS